jgi:hypothetical protein
MRGFYHQMIATADNLNGFRFDRISSDEKIGA